MQKKTLKKQTIFTALFPCFLAVLLSACGNEPSEEIPEKAFGIDYSKDLTIPLPEQVICGQESAWAITTRKDDFIYQLGFDTTTAGVEKIEWQPEEGNHSLINVAEQKGTLYAELYHQKEDTLEIRKYHAGGGWSHVLSIRTEDQGRYAVVGSGFFVDRNETVYLVSGDTVTHFDEEGKQISVYELRGEVCLFQKNAEGYVECVTASTNAITLYEFRENRAEEKWTLKGMTGPVQNIRSSETGTLCLAANREILFLDRESGSLLARTDLGKLGMASVLTGYYDAEEGILGLYDFVGNDAEGVIRCCMLRERDALAEQRTALVYGVLEKVNADAASSISTAIARFNQENGEYYVTVRDYEGNLERMYADMATGNGPDIIDMMYSDYYGSYVKNGYLEDLLPYLEQSPYKDDIIWNVLDTYRIDGGLYLFVPQFQLLGLLIHPEYEDLVEEWNMDTFLALLEKNRWEKDIFGGMVGNPDMLLDYMMCGRQEEFIDWEQKTAAFETEAFLDMLALCREYAEADWSKAMEWTDEEHRWNTLCKPDLFVAWFSMYLSNVEMYGREYPIYGYPTLSGQTYGIAACYDSCAIYTGSKQKEGAWEFIESLLWESNQKYLGVANPGFPIRSSVLKEMAEEAKTVKMRSGKNLITMTEAEISILEDIIYNGDLSHVLINPKIRAVIREETAPYFAGQKGAQETAHIIQSRIGIILAE